MKRRGSVSARIADHRFLVETLVTLGSLQVFQVAADGTFGQELGVLIEVDPTVREQAVRPGFLHRPAFADGKSLSQEREIGERLHRLDPGLRFQVVAEVIERELSFQVMHSRTQDRLAVQPHPKSHRVGPRQVGQGVVGEVLVFLLGSEVQVGEDDDAGVGMLQDLRSPAGFRSRVVAFAEVEAELFEESDQTREKPARAAERVVIVVGPSQAELVLPGFLDLSRPIPRLPVRSLPLENQVASDIRTDQLDHLIDQIVSHGKPLGVVGIVAFATVPEVAGDQGIAGRLRGHPAGADQVAGERLEAAITATLDHGKRRSSRNPTDPVRSHRVSLDGQPQIVGSREVGNRLHLDGDLADLAAAARSDHDLWEQPAIVAVNGRPHGIRRAVDLIIQVQNANVHARPVGPRRYGRPNPQTACWSRRPSAEQAVRRTGCKPGPRGSSLPESHQPRETASSRNFQGRSTAGSRAWSNVLRGERFSRG